MLTKFDSKSNRVKGLSFHSKRPWVLASLHNGVVQLWDYRMGTLLDRYEEHEGPVRGIDFHKSQPLFVSGGDDYKVKVWNYKLRRCLFTLLGHLDYIRTVQFHHEYPWIVSASDDQTIRLWNWQSRNCISVLTGHNHYVMCAQFHPREDYIVSASLDNTVRVWDTSGLRRKTVRGAPSDDTLNLGSRGLGGGLSNTGNNELFSTSDAVLKYVLEGHDRGVNWASFHPTQNLIVSGADDRLVKIWAMRDNKAWEMNSLRGHSNNVSCVIFHPRHELVISNSEDRSIRVWDIQKCQCIQTFKRESDRFWMLCVHPEQNLIAAGHDSGMVVFKLERERPAYAVSVKQLFYIRERYLRRAILGTGSDVPLISLRSSRGSGSNNNGVTLGTAPRTLVVNSFGGTNEDAVLIMSNVDGGIFELCVISTNGQETESIRGPCLAAVFTARNKYAVLERNRQIRIRSYGNDPGKVIKSPYTNVDMLFPAATPGRLLVRAEDRICLYEPQSRRMVAELTGVAVKYVIWSNDGNMVALLGKHAVVLADRDLTQICSVTETVRVKSGAWDEHGVFIYTTLNHVKYLLPLASGESGIVRTLDAPVYACEARGGNLYVLDRDAKIRALPIDPTEHLFKLALAHRQFDRVLNIIKSARLCGQAVIAYLHKAGFPEIALLFVEDDLTRFNLALQCRNLDIALKAARSLASEEAWKRLATEALQQGALEIAELAYQNISAVDRLSFLYAVTGNRDKLSKMLQVAQVRNDTQSRFHNALLLGDATEKVKVLESAGQTALAYLTAATHGLEADAQRIKGYLEAANLPVPPVPVTNGVQSFTPATPLKVLATGADIPRPKDMEPPKQGLDLAAIAAAAARLAEEQASMNSDGNAAERAAQAAAAAMAAAQAEANRLAEERRQAAALQAQADRAANKGKIIDDDGDELDNDENNEDNAWDDGVDLGFDSQTKTKTIGGGGWGDEDDLDLDDALTNSNIAANTNTNTKTTTTTPGGFMIPEGGHSVPSLWVNNSSVACDHIAAGSFKTAMDLLNRQIGIVNFTPLKPYFMTVYMGARTSIPSLPMLPSLTVYNSRAETNDGNITSAPPREKTLPSIAITLASIQAKIQRVYDAFSEGKFSECRDVLDTLFAMLPLVVVQRKEEVAEVKAILKAATEYKLAVRIMQTAKTTDATDGVRQIELAAYMTYCTLEPAHLLLALNMAMRQAYKFKNFIHAASFARRLIELPESNSAKNAKFLGDAKKILQISEQEARNALKIDYDPSTPFVICAGSLTPIYRGKEVIKSPFCGASYSPSFRNTVCVIDNMSSVGLETLGLVSSLVLTRNNK